MIDVRIVIKSMNVDFSLFKLDIGKEYIEEITDVLFCERRFNNTELDFGKLNYKK